MSAAGQTTDTGAAGAAGAAAGGAPSIFGARAEFAAFDDATKGYFQNKGWDKKTEFEVATEAAKAHREAEKFIGAPADQLIRLPKEPNDPAWKNVWQRLGAGAEAKDYDFSSVKFGDGSDLDSNFVEFMQKNSASLNLPKETATALTKEFVKFMDTVETAESAEQTARRTEEFNQLRKNWGANYDSRKFVADQAYMKIMSLAGFDQAKMSQTIKGLGDAVGGAAIMEFLCTVGQAMGEDKFIANRAPGADGFMSQTQAKATLDSRMADKDWSAKLKSGHTETMREFHNLTTLIAGQAA